jgi:hypothetical protein
VVVSPVAVAVAAVAAAAAAGEGTLTPFQSLRRFLRRNALLAVMLDPPPNRPLRTEGRPPSANGASSFHLMWDIPGGRPIVEVGATIVVTELPSVDRLYFWALQVGFMVGGRTVGGAHLGLQFHPAYPNKTAANWGGYDEFGSELSGSVSPLPSTLGNANTRDYEWEADKPYRLRIHRSPDRGWRGSITDLSTGVTTAVRDLWVEGDRLAAPMVWSEVFADCDHPSAEVAWSGLEAIDDRGESIEPRAVRVNYQTLAEGGCSNTNSEVTPGGLLQRTNTERLTIQGSMIEIQA